jgi:hypothetical protein
MRHFLAASLLMLATAGYGWSQDLTAQHSIQLVQTTPAPPPITLTLPANQTFTNCMVSCGTQQGNCQNSCLALSSGAQTGASVTIAGPTTNPTQCTLNCFTQQLVCQQSCARSQ